MVSIVLNELFTDSRNIVFPLVRIILGIIFFFQAYDKIFRLGLSEMKKEVAPLSKERGLPAWFSMLSVYASSYIELVFGFFLIIGLFTIPSLYVMSLHLMLTVLGFSYLKGLWDLKHVFPRLIMIVFLLLLPQEWNSFTIEGLIAFFS